MMHAGVPSETKMLSTPHASLYYHYTDREGIEGILKTKSINQTVPHPRNPGIMDRVSLKEGAVFFTRMDPRNDKKAIAFNNYR